jgi:hypothetical protein
MSYRVPPYHRPARAERETPAARRLKVEELASPWGIGQARERVTPLIRLKGQWLYAAGFRPDEHVRVIVEAGRLIIVPEVEP